jgi:hypothetical protein
MYEDIPYAETAGHSLQIARALDSCGSRLTRLNEDVSDVFTDKLRMVSVYGSQFKLSAIEPAIQSLAERQDAANTRAEVFCQIDSVPHVPDETQLSREADGLRRLGRATRSLMSDGLRHRTVTVLALPSGNLGRWEQSWQFLPRVFPNAVFHVYASQELAWQVADTKEKNVKITFVTGGIQGWANVVCRQFFRLQTPTLVLWRGAYCSPPMARLKRSANLLIKMVLPFRSVLLARCFADLSVILRDSSQARTSAIRSHSGGRKRSFAE